MQEDQWLGQHGKSRRRLSVWIAGCKSKMVGWMAYWECRPGHNSEHIGKSENEWCGMSTGRLGYGQSGGM